MNVNSQHNPQRKRKSGTGGGTRTHNLRFRRTYPAFAAHCQGLITAFQCAPSNGRSSLSLPLTDSQRLTVQPTEVRL